MWLFFFNFYKTTVRLILGCRGYTKRGSNKCTQKKFKVRGRGTRQLFRWLIFILTFQHFFVKTSVAYTCKDVENGSTICLQHLQITIVPQPQITCSVCMARPSSTNEKFVSCKRNNYLNGFNFFQCDNNIRITVLHFIFIL